MDLPKGQSAFLWGPRKSGKSTWLKQTFPASVRYDFLKTDLVLRFSKQPSLLREELLAMSDDVVREPVILDEVQKVPAVMDEVHWLIENKGFRFILCGSSARKLKRGHANLLGGRFQPNQLTSTRPSAHECWRGVLFRRKIPQEEIRHRPDRLNDKHDPDPEKTIGFRTIAVNQHPDQKHKIRDRHQRCDQLHHHQQHAASGILHGHLHLCNF